MNKVSSKLAAGVRKVKSQQDEAPAAAKPQHSRDGTRAMREGGVDGSAKRGAGSGSIQHPERVWPD